jgi:hypothetical protein
VADACKRLLSEEDLISDDEDIDEPLAFGSSSDIFSDNDTTSSSWGGGLSGRISTDSDSDSSVVALRSLGIGLSEPEASSDKVKLEAESTAEKAKKSGTTTEGSGGTQAQDNTDSAEKKEVNALSLGTGGSSNNNVQRTILGEGSFQFDPFNTRALSVSRYALGSEAQAEEKEKKKLRSRLIPLVLQLERDVLVRGLSNTTSSGSGTPSGSKAAFIQKLRKRITSTRESLLLRDFENGRKSAPLDNRAILEQFAFTHRDKDLTDFFKEIDEVCFEDLRSYFWAVQAASIWDLLLFIVGLVSICLAPWRGVEMIGNWLGLRRRQEDEMKEVPVGSYSMGGTEFSIFGIIMTGIKNFCTRWFSLNAGVRTIGGEDAALEEIESDEDRTLFYTFWDERKSFFRGSENLRVRLAWLRLFGKISETNSSDSSHSEIDTGGPAAMAASTSNLAETVADQHSTRGAANARRDSEQSELEKLLFHAHYLDFLQSKLLLEDFAQHHYLVPPFSGYGQSGELAREAYWKLIKQNIYQAFGDWLKDIPSLIIVFCTGIRVYPLLRDYWGQKTFTLEEIKPAPDQAEYSTSHAAHRSVVALAQRRERLASKKRKLVEMGNSNTTGH